MHRRVPGRIHAHYYAHSTYTVVSTTATQHTLLQRWLHGTLYKHRLYVPYVVECKPKVA